jgi:hypothetical protein
VPERIVEWQVRRRVLADDHTCGTADERAEHLGELEPLCVVHVSVGKDAGQAFRKDVNGPSRLHRDVSAPGC